MKGLINNISCWICRNKVLYLLIFGCFTGSLNSQNIDVSGTVISSEDKLSIPGANVFVKGKKIGTATDFEGKFYLKNLSRDDTLVFSILTYDTKIVPVGGQGIIEVLLQPSVKQINEVVVTALGVKKEKKSLGYSIQEIRGDDLQTAKDVSVVNQLSGKVAGLDVSATTGGAASSSRITLRGNNSFNDNQALIVVDGVPINNSTISNSEDTWGGMDFGNGISDINPDDIENISVLKGASASSLYGSRASNGVILITTKKGKTEKGIGITFNSSTSVDIPYVLYDFQDTYGAGRNGKFEGCWQYNADSIPVYNSSSSAAFGSWGPKMEEQRIIDWDNQEGVFDPQPNNFKDFFKNGITTNNTISLENGGRKGNIRVTFSDMRNRDIVPGTTIYRTNIAVKGSLNIIEKFKISGYVSYVKQKAKNRLGLSDSRKNVIRGYIMMPRNISDESLSRYTMDGGGNEQTWYMNWVWQSNPYWNYKYDINKDTKDRIFGNVSLSYDLMDNLSLLIRTSPDQSRFSFWERQAVKSRTNKLGSHSEREIEQLQINSDFLFTHEIDITKNISVNSNFGGNSMYDKSEEYSAHTNGGLNNPDDYSLNNSINPITQKTTLHEKAINSLYGSVQFGFMRYVFLEVTGRNDWSSTLPKSNNSYFYPSVNLGFVFSDLFDLDKKTKNKFTYGKIRISRAGVGNDTDPYLLEPVYILDSNNTEGYGTFAYLKDLIPSKSLKPEKLISNEIGADIRLFTNRVGIDFTWYHTNSYNQIIRAPVSVTSGFKEALINAGNIQNKGVELQLKIDFLKSTKIKWSSIINYTKNNSLVKELTDGVDSYVLLEHWGLSIEARPGNPYGDIVGYATLKDEDGNQLVDGDGMYIRDTIPRVLGNINPDFKLSLSNQFSYGNISFSFLIDMQIGGEMFTGSNMYGYGYSGNFVETLEGREDWYASEAAREAAGLSSEEWSPTGGYLAEGVYQEGTIIEGKDVGGQSNITYVNPQLYWDQFSSWTNEIHEPFVYDASYLKLREVTVSYKLPEKWFRKIKAQDFVLSFYGRNLWLIYSKVPNIDPESFHTNGNGQGYELYSYPGRRSIGANLKVRF